MSKIDVKVPSAGESVTEVTIGKWLVADGAMVQDGQAIVELETEKASLEVPSPGAGKLSYTRKVGEVLKIGDLLASLDTSVKGETAPPPPKQESAPPVKKEAPLPSSDGVRKSKDAYLSSLNEKPKETPVASAPIVKTQEEVTRKPLSKLRRTIAQRLVQVKNETAMLTTFNEVDMSAVMALRDAEKDSFQKKYGVKLTYMPFFMRATVEALKDFPDINAFIDKDEIVYHAHSHIGIAVSSDTGLVVPVLRNCDTLSFLEIAKGLNDLAVKARERKLTVADMSGGTFTITNGGVFGSMLSTPILNPPQSGILGMHNIVERPVAIKGKVEIRPIMYLALSYDHRIVDGKEAISFLVRIKDLLENPAKFLFV
ncbi:MAG: dihydrolipoyllysine-residue succinyltransferase [Verrucomicrobia bacterium]|nr:dihydrolipoyllysine-residue succinyltransferase [Verrucomicrobiota bacterium]